MQTYFSINQAAEGESGLHAVLIGSVVVGMVQDTSKSGQKRDYTRVDESPTQSDAAIEILKNHCQQKRLKYF